MVALGRLRRLLQKLSRMNHAVIKEYLRIFVVVFALAVFAIATALWIWVWTTPGSKDAIYLFHDDKHSVTCWSTDNGISCLPDQILQVRPETPEWQK